jgi:hypothetical protein
MEEGEFASMSKGDPLSMVVGPQGATMFVMAMRATGIDPGDPERPISRDNPLLDVVVTDMEGTEAAHYRGIHFLYPDPGEEDWFVKAGIYVIVDERPTALSGHMLTADAVLTDRHGVERCGQLTFLAEL